MRDSSPSKPPPSSVQLRTGPVSRWMKRERGYQPTPPRCIARACCIASSSREFEPDVERAAVDVLAVVGDPEGRFRQHAVGRDGAVGRQHRRAGRADPVHHGGEEIDDADIDRDPLTRMMVAQQVRQILHRRRDRSELVAVRPVEALAGMGVVQLDAARRGIGQGHGRSRRHKPEGGGEENPSVHGSITKQLGREWKGSDA